MLERRQKIPVDQKDYRVSFSPITHEQLIPRLADIHDEVIDAIWFTEKENAAMQIETLKTIKYMRKGGVENDKITFRGIEHMRSTEMLEQRKINKDAVYGAVLDEQEQQRQLGRCDPDELANASSLCSRWARRKALQLGEADAAASGRSQDESSEDTNMSSSQEQLSKSICAPAPVQSKQDQCLSILEQALQVTNTGLSDPAKEESVDQKDSSVKPMPCFSMKKHTVALPLKNSSFDERSEKKVVLDCEETYSKGPGLFMKSSTLNTSGPGIMRNLRSLMRTRLDSREDDGGL